MQMRAEREAAGGAATGTGRSDDRLRELLHAAEEANGTFRTLLRLQEAIPLRDAASPALQERLDTLAETVAALAGPQLEDLVRAGALREAKELARLLGELPPSWLEGAAAAISEGFERLASTWLGAARSSPYLEQSAALLRACGELRPPRPLSEAFARERRLVREWYGARALDAVESRLHKAPGGLAAARASLELLAPVDWSRLPDPLQERLCVALASIAKAAGQDVDAAIAASAPATRAAAALLLLEREQVEAEAALLVPEERRPSADGWQHLAARCLDAGPGRSVQAVAEELLDDDEPDPAAVAALVSRLDALRRIEAQLAAEERAIARGNA